MRAERTDLGMLKPRGLRHGDRIGLLALASAFDRPLFDAGVIELEKLGFEPVFDERVFDRSRYLAGDAESRGLAFKTAWEDPDIAGIMAVRGGYGSSQILPFLNQKELSETAKVVVGCSDITSVLTSVVNHWICMRMLVGPLYTYA